MSQMKSAFERAMERAEALGALTPEEKLKIEFQPRGEAAAVGHMNGKAGLASSLEACGPDARPHFAAGASRVLVSSITLGLTEIDQERNARAFEGLRVVKSDKKALERAVALIDNIQSMYRQAYGPTVEQARQETRQRMEQGLQEAARTNPGLSTSGTDVESMPEFQGRLAQAVMQFTSQYQDALEEQKANLEAIA